MIIEALYRYYKILLDDPEVEIAAPGYSSAGISYALNLAPQGELIDIVPLFRMVQEGKRLVERPLRMRVPEQAKKASGIKANFLCDNAAYVLGLADEEKSAKDPGYTQKRFDAFRKFNSEILSRAGSGAASAIIAFLQAHHPQTASQHPVIAPHLEGLRKGGNLVFQVNGINALDDPEIQHAWEEHILGEEAVIMQCLVTGEKAPVARLHPSIKSVHGAKSTGASLVSFNERAYESYNRTGEQGLNSPVSQRVASGYGVTLNYLLSEANPNRPIYLGDTNVVYWAESADPRYGGAISALFNPAFYDEPPAGGQPIRDKQAEITVGEVGVKIARGQALDAARLVEGLDGSTRFYILGLAANVSRLSVRFFLNEPFGRFIERVIQHYQDMQIQKESDRQPDFLSPYRVLAECVSPKVTRREDEIKASWSLLSGAFLRAILTGAPYPESLYAAIINRVRHDSDEENRSIKISYPRAAFIKAHLIRKYQRQARNPYQEALQMSLNESYTHPAYVLGRLFAVLEKAQKEAIGLKINATIKDRYFTSACATPAIVFPTLMRLSQHYFDKAEYGGPLEHQVQVLLGLLDAGPFPARLTLEQQGVFILGYYHQRGYRKAGGADKIAQPETEEITA